MLTCLCLFAIVRNVAGWIESVTSLFKFLSTMKLFWAIALGAFEFAAHNYVLGAKDDSFFARKRCPYYLNLVRHICVILWCLSGLLCEILVLVVLSSVMFLGFLAMLAFSALLVTPYKMLRIVMVVQWCLPR